MLTIVTIVFFYGCHGKQEGSLKVSYSISQQELSKLQSGDVIMRMGYGAMSMSIVTLLNDTVKLSHCGVVLREGSDLLVIHTISPSLSNADGMQRCTMEEFILDSRDSSIIVVRFKQGGGQLIAQKAAYYLAKQVPFDAYFDLVDSSTFFCSELPIRILKDELGVDILEEKEPTIENCRFSIFLNPQYFDVLINHQVR